MSDVKRCQRCANDKPLTEFYSHPRTADRLRPNCKACHNADPKTVTSARINRQRARNRATADLVAMYPDEFAALLAIRLAEAAEEAEALAQEPEAKKHYGKNNTPARLRPGKRMPGQKASDRIDVARCPHCIKHHDRGHVCESCGAKPDDQKLDSRYLVSTKPAPKPPPSGVRPRRAAVDPAALAEFNAGTERARQAARR